ncbi:MAG: radical SAM protein [Candidatus Woesearchaeota archaeon]|jgi:radical SAM protein with 4Fe4S-binding SPASM domain
MIPKTFLHRVFIKSGSPIHLIWFVTSKCNLRCLHCFYHEEVASPLNKELSHDEMIKIISNLPPLLSLVLTGGEPLLRADIYELVKCINDRKICNSIRICTNGHATDRTIRIIDKILTDCTNQHFFISVSLDGFEKDHDMFRQVSGAYKNTIATILALKELQKKHPHFEITINTTLHDGNQKVMQVFREDTYKKVGIYPGITVIRGDPKSKELKKVDLEIYKKTIKNIERDRINLIKESVFKTLVNTREVLGHEMAFKTFSTNKRDYDCYAGSLMGVIYASGDVFPCEMLPNASYGNIKNYDYDLKKIWNSDKANKIRQSIKERKCACTYECQFTTNTLYNLNNWPRFIKDLVKHKIFKQKK